MFCGENGILLFCGRIVGPSQGSCLGMCLLCFYFYRLSFLAILIVFTNYAPIFSHYAQIFSHYAYYHCPESQRPKSGLASRRFSKNRKNLIVSLTDDNSDREREVQDIGNKDVMYELLFRRYRRGEADGGSRFCGGNGVTRLAVRHGAGGFCPKNEERLAAQDRLGTSGEERVDRRSRHKWTSL